LRLSAYAQGPSPLPASDNREQARDKAPAEIILHEELISPEGYRPGDDDIGDADSVSPWMVMYFSAELMEKEGANTPIEGLRQIPFFLGTTRTENDSSGGSGAVFSFVLETTPTENDSSRGNGAAFINLRALGAKNVLTLINGRRAFGFSDINAIPIGALSRAEVLKDGASAIYGSNAVAGVVNFILLNGPGDKPYEGAEIYALYGNTTDSDAHVRQVYVRGGVTGLDGKVSIAAAGEYYSRANLFSRDREISQTGDLSNNATGLGLGGLNNNSPTYAGRVSVSAAGSSAGFPTGQLVLSDLTTNQVTPGSYRRFDVPAGSDPSRFNFQAFTPAIPAMEKAMYYVTGRYKIFGEGLQLYGDVMYSHVKQDNGLAGSPFAITGPSNGLTEAKANQWNPFGSALTSLRYRLQQELGGRRSFFDKDFERYVVGINGDFNIKDNGFISRFGYDSGFVYEHFRQLETDSGDAVRSALNALIGANLFNPFIGQFAPIVGEAPTYVDGVPTGQTAHYDNTSAAAPVVDGGASYVGHSLFLERDWSADVKINAHLFPNLWNGGIDFALGYEHRDISQHTAPDAVLVLGDQLGFSQSPDSKFGQEANAVFFEFGIPIVTSTMNIPGIRSLDFSLAWRYEKFDDRDQLTKQTGSFDNVNDDEDFGGAPRVSLRYQPIADITLRASWGQSYRSPSPANLFDPIVQDFPPFFGVDTVGPPLGVWRRGNPELKPEKTDTYSAGVVWTPKFIPGFTMTADWYQLFSTDLILGGNDFARVLLANNVIDPDGCGNGSGSPEAPGGPGLGVTADENGSVQCIDSAIGNAGKRHVQGIDVTAVYELPTERFGKFTFSGGWNHFFTWKAQPGTGAFNNFLGNYNNGTLPLAPGAIPWNKAFLRGEWEWRHFDFVATGNYIGDFRDDPAFDSIVRDHPRNVPSYITLDMQLSYEFVKATAEPPTYAKDSKDSKNVMQTAAETSSIWQRILWGTKLTVGVNNAFDRNPPTVLAAPNDNYDTSLYSIRNRYYYIAFDKKF
jgi:iron complex outermembrane recepter protein